MPSLRTRSRYFLTVSCRAAILYHSLLTEGASKEEVRLGYKGIASMKPSEDWNQLCSMRLGNEYFRKDY